jgi:hypothetical protein
MERSFILLSIFKILVMKILYGVIFILFPLFAIGQKHDYTWLWSGYRSDTVDYNIYGNFIDFNINYRKNKVEKVKHVMDQVNASISDKDGKFLFYFDGCTITGADHKTIENGDSINYSDWWKSISNCETGYTGPGNTLILPDPANENGYYIIHKTIDWVQFPKRKTISALGLKSTYVDMNENGGSGKVIYKNKWIYQDTVMWGYLHAVKHANGRDWWLVDLKETIEDGSKTNAHHLFKLDINGIEKKNTQFFGPLFSDNSSACGAAKFSPDGTKWAYYCKRDGLWLLDFDRSTGILSNYKYHNIYHNYSGSGLEWSANGRFLYISTLDSLFQYDTWASDLKASEALVDVWDKTSNPFQTIFALMQRGPDCRIYMSSRSSTNTIHVINNPDEPAPFCNFVQHDLKLFSNTGSVSMPIFPNYRLDSGPVCDPGIKVSAKDITDLPKTDLRVYPNPATDLFYVESSYEYKDVKVSIADMSGKIWWHGEHHKTMSFSADHFTSGVYVIRMEHKGETIGISKLVIVK